ncbi:MAG: glutamate-1-semialdehyde 2,1-aminomutase [Phycisphaerales bacterium]
MNRSTAGNDAAFRRGERVLVGGVSSPVRAFRSVGGVPRVIVRARGPRIEDVDGRTYLDYVGAWGAGILGHAHPSIVDAIRGAALDGASFGTASVGDVALAESIIARVPSVERVRFTNSGTEAVMTALRIARAATGRELVVKFDGCYHGHADGLLVKAGSGPTTLGLPDSPGVVRASASSTISVPFNDRDSLARAFRAAGERIAAVVVEPVAGNMGVVAPLDGFLEQLRETCDRFGALLVFDEVMTGFRVARGGAQDLFRVRPDLSAFGKIIGGGLPVGAVGGPAHLMELLAPIGPVYQGGTFSGNPVVMAAGSAALARLDDDAYAQLERSSARLERGLRGAMARRGLRATVNRVGSMLTLFFGTDCVRRYDDALACDAPTFATFFHAMLDRGVHLPPSAYEAWFVSLAHDDDAIDATIDAADEAMSEIASDVPCAASPPTPPSTSRSTPTHTHA